MHHTQSIGFGNKVLENCFYDLYALAVTTNNNNNNVIVFLPSREN